MKLHGCSLFNVKQVDIFLMLFIVCVPVLLFSIDNRNTGICIEILSQKSVSKDFIVVDFKSIYKRYNRNKNGMASN